MNVWKQPDECCGHAPHEPGACRDCNCGEDEKLHPHGHTQIRPSTDKFAAFGNRGARHIGPTKPDY